MLDDLRSYLQLASGVTEATTSKAKEVVTGLLSSGLSMTSKAVPAPEMMGQVQELADDLVATSKSNRDMLTGMIRSEVDRAVGRMGFVREDELAALRRHVQRLEAQLTELQAESDARANAEEAVGVAEVVVVDVVEVEPVVDEVESVVVEVEPVVVEVEPVVVEVEPVVVEVEPVVVDAPRKKKKIVLEQPEGE